MLAGLKRFILWDYARATWQYDVMVAVIVVFVLFTPRAWFHDQPRIPGASAIVSLPGMKTSQMFWIEPELVSPLPESGRMERLSLVLRQKTGRNQVITSLQPIYDSEQEIKGYVAVAKP